MNSFQENYHIIVHHCICWTGVCVAVAIYVAVGVVCGTIAFAFGTDWQSCVITGVVGSLNGYALMCRSAMMTFLKDGIKSANIMLLKKSTFSLCDTELGSHGGSHGCDLFDNQWGDCLNMARPRGFVFAKVQCVQSGQLVVLAGVHLSLGGETNRIDQIKQVKAKCKEIGGSAPSIVMGGFNAVEDSSTIAAMTSDYTDAFEKAGHGCGHTWQHTPLSQGWLRVPDHRCDYIFCRPGSGNLKLSSCTLFADNPVEGTYLSDHFGVICDVNVH